MHPGKGATLCVLAVPVVLFAVVHITAAVRHVWGRDLTLGHPWEYSAAS